LAAKYIVHVVTPYLNGEKTQPQLHLTACASVLSFIDGVHVRRLAVGPISTGYYGFPMVEAAVLFFRCLRGLLLHRPSDLDLLVLWIYNESQNLLYKALLDVMFRNG
jgi:O-acetyl-ADP-ribose deacetylase (regulator of RNase III)